jgi:hypothetical protein
MLARIWQAHQSRRIRVRCDGEVVGIPRKAKGKSAMKAIRVLLLVLAISVSAYAGEMETDRTGDMPCGITGDMGNGGRTAVTDPVIETAMQILQSLSLLF